ncbi:hypothetical protein ACOTVD_11050 [Campylobacter jejuni]|uniref:hypothetical protein n=1 Tax=Campylobacter jejuni TaxID=197 RepID=UPI003B9D9725
MNEKVSLTKKDYLYSYGFAIVCYIGIFFTIYNDEISFFANIFVTFFVTLFILLIGFFIGLSQLIQALFMISCEILFFISKLLFKRLKIKKQKNKLSDLEKYQKAQQELLKTKQELKESFKTLIKTFKNS